MDDNTFDLLIIIILVVAISYLVGRIIRYEFWKQLSEEERKQIREMRFENGETPEL